MDDVAKSEFGQFLISRRARLSPADVGLPDSGRRRTPGLRREEVAAIAGVSVDYLARLEQGRDTNPSAAILMALGKALQLDEADRNHFGWLALKADPKSECSASPPAQEQLSAPIAAVLDSMNPVPAFVLGRQLNLLGWNPAWEEFAEPLGLFDPEAHNNIAVFTFAVPAARKAWRDWDNEADVYTSRLRSAMTRWPDDDDVAHTIGRLKQFPEFMKRWDAHVVDAKPAGTLRVTHPHRGSIDIAYETLEMTGQSLVVWLTERGAVRAPRLRLIEGRASSD
ncbi:helix-turn-helix transcriptional regulator [Antrihabitans spumae]|uniref:Helix-turn-helix transcriptional regulator n=1 Tax=Antrihabitans spumae TaxID=3373370 RepID=A0ABW7KSC5_9NOCA